MDLRRADSDPGLLDEEEDGGEGDGEEIERLGQAHPPREGLPEGGPVQVYVVTLGRIRPKRTDTRTNMRTDSTWRWVSGTIPVPRSRKDRW